MESEKRPVLKGEAVEGSVHQGTQKVQVPDDGEPRLRGRREVAVAVVGLEKVEDKGHKKERDKELKCHGSLLGSTTLHRCGQRHAVEESEYSCVGYI